MPLRIPAQAYPLSGRRPHAYLLCSVALLGLVGVVLCTPEAHGTTAGERYFLMPAPEGKVQVDGKLDEWGDLGTPITIGLGNLAGGYVTGSFSGPEDCSGRMRMVYDLEYLYIALSVRDDSVRPLETESAVPGKFWEQDGLGLYLDVPGVNVASGRYDTRRTRPWQPEPILQLTPSLNDYGAAVLPEGSLYGCTISPQGYTVEAAVPWKALGWYPQVGDRILFAAILADVDRDAEGRDLGLAQFLWHFPPPEVRPNSRGWAEARLVNEEGYGAEVITSRAVLLPGEPLEWKVLADANRTGWQVSEVTLLTPERSRKGLIEGAARVAEGQRLALGGQINTTGLTPGLYALQATGTRAGKTEQTRQALSVADPAMHQLRTPDLPRRHLTPDPLRSGFSAERARPPRRQITHQDYREFVDREIAAGWPSVEYHVLNRSQLGGSWYFDLALRHAAYAVVSQDPVWAQRALTLFELANEEYQRTGGQGLGWINFPLIYYCKQYLNEVNLWRPEHDEMVKDWFRMVWPEYPKDRTQVWYGMNNWGLSSGIRGVMGKYWLGEELPDRELWEKHIEDTWGVFLHEIKDHDENTTNYAPWNLWLALFYLDVTGQIDLLRTDDELRYMFERYIYETAPSGARPHYGDTNGWHDSVPMWMYIFERVGQVVGDGRYKQQSRLMWEYALRHVVDWRQYHLVYDQAVTMLTRLLAEVPDDSLPAQPVAPEPILTLRGATHMLSPEERAARNQWIEMTAERVPNKLIFRSSNDPGSMWAMVELNNDAGHFAALPTALNCLMDKETVLLASQGYYEKDPQFHNLVFIEDLEGTQGVQPEMDIQVPTLEDHALLTYAVAEVHRYMRWPLTLRRHFVFVKDRFMWVRDELDFQSSFFARIGPSWLSRQMFSSGENWTNTYFDLMPYTGLGQGNGMHYWKNHNYDLLTYFVPRAGMQLDLTDLTSHNLYMNAPLRVRQTWRGLAREGEKLYFDSVLLPHPVVYQKPDAQALAETFELLAAEPDQAAVEFELPWRQEKALVVMGGRPFSGGGVETDAELAVIIWKQGEVSEWFVRNAKTLKVADAVLVQSPTPVTQGR